MGIATAIIICSGAFVGYLLWLYRTRHPNVRWQAQQLRYIANVIRKAAQNIGVVPKIKIGLSFFQVATVILQGFEPPNS